MPLWSLQLYKILLDYEGPHSGPLEGARTKSKVCMGREDQSWTVEKWLAQRQLREQREREEAQKEAGRSQGLALERK